MSRRLLLGLFAVALLAALLAAGRWGTASVLPVAPGEDVAALAAAHPGATLALQPGRHDGFALDHPAVVRGAEGAVVAGEIHVRADGVALHDLDVRAARNGVTVRDADGVVLDGLRVRGAELHGIELIASSAAVYSCRIDDLRGQYAQGIEVRNANGRGVTVVEGCTVEGGMEGIVSHVSRIIVRDNVVHGQTMRGIVITEMSEGLAERNRVRGVTGVGVFCGDMSHCEVRDNAIGHIAADPAGIRSRGGQGIVAWYYSTLRAHGNAFEALEAAEPVDVYHGSVTTERFPLAIWWHGWRGTLPGAPYVLAFLGVLVALRVLAGPVVRRLPLPAARTPARRPRLAWRDGAFLMGAVYLVQSFHMVEHVVQVVQTYVASAENRSGVLGMRADTEWVHFVYNLAVLGFLWLLWRAVRRERTVLDPVGGTAVTLGATLALQGYHFVEHGAKLWQHLSLGIDPGPGLLGGRVGLVWFHFAINLAVHAGLTVVLWRLWRGSERAVPSLARGEAAGSRPRLA